MFNYFLDPGMNGDLSDTQDSRSSNDSGDLGPDDDNSLDSDKALNLVINCSLNLILFNFSFEIKLILLYFEGYGRRADRRYSRCRNGSQ